MALVRGRKTIELPAIRSQETVVNQLREWKRKLEDAIRTVTVDAGAIAEDALLKDGSVQLTANWDAGDYQIRSKTFRSDAVTGTIPWVTASSSKCTNLNADYVDTIHAATTATAGYLLALDADKDLHLTTGDASGAEANFTVHVMAGDGTDYVKMVYDTTSPYIAFKGALEVEQRITLHDVSSSHFDITCDVDLPKTEELRIYSNNTLPVYSTRITANYLESYRDASGGYYSYVLINSDPGAGRPGIAFGYYDAGLVIKGSIIGDWADYDKFLMDIALYVEEKIVSESTIEGTQLISTIAIGTAPLVVTSTTMVSNLNAEFLGGHNAAYFEGLVPAGVLLADASVPLTNDWDVGAWKITAEQLESDVADGTIPIIVTSEEMCTHLNADMLDDLHYGEFSLVDHDHAFDELGNGDVDDDEISRIGLADNRDRLVIWSDCLNNDRDAFFLNATSGGAVVAGSSKLTSNRPGQIAIGVNSVGDYSRRITDVCIVPGGGALTLEISMNLAQASDATNDYTVIWGLFDTINSVTQANGIFFRYNYATPAGNPGNLEIVTAASSTRTENDSGQAAPATDTWHTYKIVTNADWTSISFYYDGVELSNSPITTNLPTSRLAFGILMESAAGAATKYVFIDWMYLKQIFTTART